MKYLFLVCLAITLAGCTRQDTAHSEATSSPSPSVQVIYERYDDEVRKFRDGDVTCYLYRGINKGGISCLRDATGSASKEESL